MKELKASEPLLLDGVLTPDAILKDPTLSAGARLLWVLLAEYQGKVPECYPSQEMLAVPLGVKVRQLQSLIKELESYTRGDPPEPFPLVEVKLVFVEKDRKTRNIYNLLRWPFLAVDGKANGAERPHLADGGDAQYSAHRSEGEAQDAAAAPLAMPSKGGAVANGMPPSDTQSSAQDTAAALPEMIEKDGGLAPHGMPPGDTQSSAYQSAGATPDTVARRRAMATEEGDAQYSAHRSGGDAQDAAPAPPGIPSENVGAVPTGNPPSDTQSSAHRSDCGALDTASGRPELHWTEYGEERARARYMKSLQVRQQQTRPQDSVFNRNAGRPLGSGDWRRQSLEEPRAPVNDIPPDIRKRPAVASGPLAAPRSKRPGYVEFPKCKYHADREAVVVDNAEGEAKLGEGWQDVPV
jgi:hypothetical protein